MQGSRNGILWMLDNNSYCIADAKSCGPTVLHAYDATNLATELWNSKMVSGDAAGNAIKFTVPTTDNSQ